MCTRACADVVASIKSVGVWAPSLYINRPPSWGVFSLMTFAVIEALGTGSASRRARSLHKHPEKQPEQTSLLEAVPGIFPSRAVWSGRARESAWV